MSVWGGAGNFPNPSGALTGRGQRSGYFTSTPYKHTTKRKNLHKINTQSCMSVSEGGSKAEKKGDEAVAVLDKTGRGWYW
ncbi:hypothetical protein E2C01_044783 [Portunus trituberculatus]|uniref:Uncharacterized protein n=1 Tax=Portunus trituberculatus TaxID=210409 RepID=A0A5B7G1E9_PORTR|nr:hypothetical protein [Portunus trituberculatus]